MHTKLVTLMRGVSALIMYWRKDQHGVSFGLSLAKGEAAIEKGTRVAFGFITRQRVLML